MPSGLISSFASKSGKSTSEVEKLWDKAKAAAEKQLGVSSGDNFYRLTTGILKRMLKIDEDGEGGAAPVAPSNTLTTANIAPGQSGTFSAKMTPLFKRKKKKKNESIDLIESYGKNDI
jgi:hypothetical protein